MSPLTTASELKTRSLPQWVGWVAVILLLLLALSKIAIQDMPRMRASFYTVNDMQSLYLASAVWARGENPYQVDALFHRMQRTNPQGAATLQGRCGVDCRAYYPPSALPILALFSSVPWTPFYITYLLLTAAAYAALLITLSGQLATRLQRWLFVAVALAFSPLHAGIDTGNVSIALCSLSVVALFWLRSRPALAGVMLGIIACMKPPLAAVFIVYLILSRQWKALLRVIATGLIVAGSALGWMYVHHVEWLTAYRSNIADFSPYANGATGLLNHGTPNFGFLNLQAFLFVVTGSISAAVAVNYALVALLLAGFAVLLQKCRRAPELPLLAIASAITLTQTSIQYYNGVLLLVAVVYVLQQRRALLYLWLGVPLLSFLLPPTVLLLAMRAKGSGAAMAHQRMQWAGAHFSTLQEVGLCLPALIVVEVAAGLLILLFVQCRRQDAVATTAV